MPFAYHAISVIDPSLLSEQIIMPSSIRCHWEEIFPENKRARLEGLEPPTRCPDFVEVVGREFVSRRFRPAHPPAHDLPNTAFISSVFQSMIIRSLRPRSPGAASQRPSGLNAKELIVSAWPTRMSRGSGPAGPTATDWAESATNPSTTSYENCLSPHQFGFPLSSPKLRGIPLSRLYCPLGSMSTPRQMGARLEGLEPPTRCLEGSCIVVLTNKQ